MKKAAVLILAVLLLATTLPIAASARAKGIPAGFASEAALYVHGVSDSDDAEAWQKWQSAHGEDLLEDDGTLKDDFDFVVEVDPSADDGDYWFNTGDLRVAIKSPELDPGDPGYEEVKATPSWPTPSATASSTIPTASSWKARSPCASERASRKPPKAPPAHRALPGPGVYRFGFSRKASALTRKRKATQRAAFPPNLASALVSLSSVALSSDASKSTFMVTLFSPNANIQRRGDTAQSRR